MNSITNKIKKLPTSPGVYTFLDKNNRSLYIGKATNLKSRVGSYFQKAHDSKIEMMLADAVDIHYQLTPSAIEALILESNLIKKYKPKYNTMEKDDKSYLWIKIAKMRNDVKQKEELLPKEAQFPKVELIRQHELERKKDKRARYFGPYTGGRDVRYALDTIRKIICFRDCNKFPNRPCLYFETGLCKGPCVGYISSQEYNRDIRNLILFLQGKKQRVVDNLEKEMAVAAKNQQFEKASVLRNQIQALQHIQDIAQISFRDIRSAKKSLRIEGFDISNIGAQYAVGAMVVWQTGNRDQPAGFQKKDYKRFKTRTIEGINDVGMLGEVISRRLKHSDWPESDLIIIDGGLAQLSAAWRAQRKLDLNIPMLSIAKGPSRKGEKVYTRGRKILVELLLIKKIRDEAHRFAVSYHKKIRSRSSRESQLDNIPGLGPTLKKKLLAHFGSIDKIKRSSIDELGRIHGVSIRLAEKIKRHIF